MAYRTSPADLENMPPGVPHIIGNEAAERFSFYGMKAVLAVFMVNYLHLMDGSGTSGMSEAEATAHVHLFNSAVYLTPFLGALLADAWWGKYRTIIALSLVYCAGHAALACMGMAGQSPHWLATGLGFIALGSGGIKPCVSAHVGDQFGARNSHLIPRIFNWFYFAINLGAFLSMLLTPWLLEWHGPHWAFGVPGVLMALATLVFWLGRDRFIHIPAGGRQFFGEIFSGNGGLTLLKLFPLYAFVAIFWALFDQTGSTWIFQARDMERRFLGFEWLPSQIQSLNSVFVLTFIPLFTFLVYPVASRFWNLTPLRKISVGLFLMTVSFGLVGLIQEWIDSGQRPNIGWQIIAFALLTAAEVMVSIVALEFAYTQAPRSMKSLVMCLYLGAVAVGNLLVAGVNHLIQIPDSAAIQLSCIRNSLPENWRETPRTIVLQGHDGTKGTEDDLLLRVVDESTISLEIPGHREFETASRLVSEAVSNHRMPENTSMNRILAQAKLSDPWGQPIRYRMINSNQAKLFSPGPDRKSNTRWDIGLLLDLPLPSPPRTTSWTDSFHPSEPWLERRKKELGLPKPVAPAADGDSQQLVSTAFSGGQTRLHGAPYFHFFTGLMFLTALLFIPYAVLYKPRNWLQE